MALVAGLMVWPCSLDNLVLNPLNSGMPSSESMACKKSKSRDWALKSDTTCAARTRNGNRARLASVSGMSGFLGPLYLSTGMSSISCCCISFAVSLGNVSRCDSSVKYLSVTVITMAREWVLTSPFCEDMFASKLSATA